MGPITATYRLQLHRGFRFDDARAIVDYLDALGISHAYASPYFASVPGSTHGYDGVDPRRLDPELGEEADYLAWCEALAARGMGHIVDFVPNHLSASTHNPFWTDVLENGPASTWADTFDIEWHPPKTALENKVLLPILGAPYGEVLERGEITLAREGGAFVLRYWDHRLPVNPRTTAPLLARAAAKLGLEPDDPRRQELESVVRSLDTMPSKTETDDASRRERAREKEVVKRRIAALCEDEGVRAAIDGEVAALDVDALDALLLAQCYRLAFWRVATEEINYRRFFDIDGLAAVRMEHPPTFDAMHALLLRYVSERRIAGVRLDHTDGLYDPASYFAKLRAAMGSGPLLVAEKILARGEGMPIDWRIDGTTGYDFLDEASGVFVDRRSEATFERLWVERTGDRRSFADHVLEGKRAIMKTSLSSEIHMLATKLERIASRDRRSRDFTHTTLRRAIRETIAAFPVYRTYLRPDGSRGAHDDETVERAVTLAKRRNPLVDPSVFDFLRDVLLLRGGVDDARVELAMRFQQLTGPVAAKGTEDTAFYTYLRFVGLNEVGGEPARFGVSPAELHAGNARRQAHWPRTLLATTTHDTKRSEDVRARLAVLTEIPERWAAWVTEWDALAARHLARLDEGVAPSPADLLLFYQTVVGAWPMEVDVPLAADRIAAVMLKSAREAKQRTSWLVPNEDYEAALGAFVTGMFEDAAFVTSVREKVRTIVTHGASNGLGLVLAKIASPGIADTYQGSELWDQRLVDPDNRGEVDFAKRRALLAQLDEPVGALLASFADGRVKMRVLRDGLRARRSMPEVFVEGDYAPLEVGGDDVVAFGRGGGAVIAAFVRAPVTVTHGRGAWAVGDVWGARTMTLPPGRYRDVFTGAEHEGETRLARLFDALPVTLLVRHGS